MTQVRIELEGWLHTQLKVMAAQHKVTLKELIPNMLQIEVQTYFTNEKGEVDYGAK